MSDFLAEVLIEGRAVIEKEIEVNGKKGMVHFRRVTAGERQLLLKGQKIVRSGKAMSYEIDLSLNEEQQQVLVQLSVCKPDGTAYFKDLLAVKQSDGATVRALYKVAAKLNGEKEDDEEPGKS